MVLTVCWQVPPRVRAIYMAIEYGVPLLQALWYDGWFAVLSWLPCATANVISGMALAVLLDLQRQLGMAAGVSTGTRREAAVAPVAEVVSSARPAHVETRRR